MIGMLLHFVYGISAGGVFAIAINLLSLDVAEVAVVTASVTVSCCSSARQSSG